MFIRQFMPEKCKNRRKIRDFQLQWFNEMYNRKYALHTQMNNTIDIMYCVQSVCLSRCIPISLCVSHPFNTYTSMYYFSPKSQQKRENKKKKHTLFLLLERIAQFMCDFECVSLELFSQIYRWKLETGHETPVYFNWIVLYNWFCCCLSFKK